MPPAGGTVTSLGPAKGRGQGQNPALSALDGRQVAASNSTLNAWVGRRQPSWLTNATPVQPTPRPARPPPVTATPSAATPATETTSCQPQPQPKPQCRLQPHPPSRPPCQARRHPQPTLPPQPQSSAQSPRQPVPSPPAASTSPPAPSLPSDLVTAGPLQLSTSLADPALLSPAPSDAPSPCLSLLRDSLNPRNPCPVSPHNDLPTTESHFVFDSHVNPRPLSSPQSQDLVFPAHIGQSASPQGATQAQSPPAASSAEEMALNTPTPIVIDDDSSDSVPGDISQSIAPKRRRIENNALAFLEAHRAQVQLEACLQEMGGEHGLEESVERPRFLLLMKACRDGDLFFVALHQLFCSWTASQASVHGLCDENVHDTSLVDNAFGIMGTVLKANSKLRETVLRWFANFPVPFDSFRVHWFYAATVHQVLNFLILVSGKWSIVNHEHLLAGYPLLMSELINTFHLYSPILQSIVFRASRRTLGAPDQPIGVLLDELFRVDQEKHRNPDDGTYSLRLEGAAYEEYNNSLAKKYQSVIRRHKLNSHVRSSHSPSIPPASTAQSSGVSTPLMVGEQLQADMKQGLRPAPPAIITGRIVPSNGRIIPSNGQNIHSPSPTYSPIAPQPMVIPNTTATFTPQFAAMAPHVLPSSPTTGIVTSPYQSPNIPQQGQYGTSNLHTQQIAQQRHLENLRQQQHQYRLLPLHRFQQQQQQLDWQFQIQQQHQQRQQQQQQQQLQQFQYLQRKRSQPGAAPSPRPSPVQTTHSLPVQVPPAGQLLTQFQNINSHAVSPAPFRNLAPVPVPSNLAHQPGPVDSSLSPQAVNVVQSNDVRRSLVRPQRRPAQQVDRLIPGPGLRINLQDYPHTPYDRRSVDHSLHQAHLRSPKRIPRALSAAPSERHYQAIKDFALEPTPIPPHAYLYEFTFNVADIVIGKLALNEKIAGEVLPVNFFSNGSLRIRARCCNLSVTTDPIPDHAWVTAETTWPDHIFMSLNHQVIEIKRKQHHSKDLPVEISSLVRLGVNTVSIAVLAQNTQREPQTPYFAVEIVEVLSHSAILQMVHASGSRSANETREVIQKRLTGGLSDVTGDNDDLEIPNDGISIDLADPFTATIFKVPVRGKACKHLECFDLENWLNTRLGKKSPCVCGGPNCKCPKEPSFVDKWKCPFCDSDARPYSLYIDEFLAEIRSCLEKNKQLRTKSVTVYADGSWKANDPAGDDDSDTESDDDGTRATPKATSKPSMPRNIIELDDE